MALADHANILIKKLMVSGVHSDFFTKVKTNLFRLVMPWPKRLFHDNTSKDSCLLNAPASPCIPIGIVEGQARSGNAGCLVTKSKCLTDCQYSKAWPTGPVMYRAHQSLRLWKRDWNIL